MRLETIHSGVKLDIERQFSDLRWELGKQILYAAFAVLGLLFIAIVNILRLLTDSKGAASGFADDYGIFVILLFCVGTVVWAVRAVRHKSK